MKELIIKFNWKEQSRRTVGFIPLVFILLWSYTATSKLANFQEFKQQIFNQAFSYYFAKQLIWFIPSIELVAALLLIIKSYRFIGLILSAGLMASFSIYITLVLTGFYNRVPCSCAGLFKSWSWQNHLYFNIILLLLSIWGSIQIYKNTKTGGPNQK